MDTIETFYRGEPLSQEKRTLSHLTYNLAHTLLHRLGPRNIFVPIRSMQYLAVIDHEEIIFMHRESARTIEISWQQFQPHERNALDQPVAYLAIYYHPDATETMKRLQPEFYEALQILDSRNSVHTEAEVIPMHANQSKADE